MRARPKLGLSESWTNEAVAAIMRRYGGHPIAIGSNFFDKQTTDLFQGLKD